MQRHAGSIWSNLARISIGNFACQERMEWEEAVCFCGTSDKVASFVAGMLSPCFIPADLISMRTCQMVLELSEIPIKTACVVGVGVFVWLMNSF